MAQKPTLLILAAGMGSRYGKLKQMDAFGPNGETIIDYSIHDAIEAGFGKVVFVVRDIFRAEFEARFNERFADKVELVYVNQDLTDIPSGFEVPEGREKPWGTAHAVWVAHNVIDGPFAVINADDFYGAQSYKVLVDYFNDEGIGINYAVVGYKLKNTLSDHGTVNRGVCFKNEDGNLEKVVEHTKIQRMEDGSIQNPEGEGDSELSDDTLVSMNMWAFRPSFFSYFDDGFPKFMESHGNGLKTEYYIPKLIDDLISENILDVEVLETDSDWFGVTYQEDKPIVQEKLNKLIADGIYPENLFEKES